MYAPHVKAFNAARQLQSRLVAERPRYAAAVRVLELQARGIGRAPC